MWSNMIPVTASSLLGELVIMSVTQRHMMMLCSGPVATFVLLRNLQLDF